MKLTETFDWNHMHTQLQPTPIVTGESAKKIKDFMKIEPTEEAERGKQILRKMFTNEKRDTLIDDLNSILKDHFDFVSLDTTIKIADKLIEKNYTKLSFDGEFVPCIECVHWSEKDCNNYAINCDGCYCGERKSN